MLNSWEHIPFPLIRWDAKDLHSRKLTAGSQKLVVEILFCKKYFQVRGWSGVYITQHLAFHMELRLGSTRVSMEVISWLVSWFIIYNLLTGFTTYLYRAYNPFTKYQQDIAVYILVGKWRCSFVWSSWTKEKILLMIPMLGSPNLIAENFNPTWVISYDLYFLQRFIFFRPLSSS